MTPRTRTAIVLLMFAPGLASCDRPGLPSAPSSVAQPNPQPPPSQGSYTLTLSSNSVAPGGQLSVSWTASSGGKDDSIGLFSMGPAPCHDGAWWWGYTHSATTGTFALTAPTQPGQYEFRYYRDDECVETARSSPVTVHTGY
jgi:hypothetical protein